MEHARGIWKSWAGRRVKPQPPGGNGYSLGDGDYRVGARIAGARLEGPAWQGERRRDLSFRPRGGLHARRRRFREVREGAARCEDVIQWPVFLLRSGHGLDIGGKRNEFPRRAVHGRRRHGLSGGKRAARVPRGHVF